MSAAKTAPAKKTAARTVAAKKIRRAAPAKRPVAKKASTPAAKKAPAAKPPVAAKQAKIKQKLIRDSFTMPAVDFALIDVLKERALGFRRPTKKSELLRAGLQVLAGLSSEQLQASLGALAPLKTGRPKKNA